MTPHDHDFDLWEVEVADIDPLFPNDGDVGDGWARGGQIIDGYFIPNKEEE